jgi:hypothetical protein
MKTTAMKTIVKVLATTLIAAGTAMSGTLAQARDINVGVSIGGEFQPGVYGQVNVNTMPAYSMVYPQPTVVVAQPVYAAPVQPVYMYVPPAHIHHWHQHCGYYNACSRPVYFVQPNHGHRRHGHGHGHGHHKGRGHGHHHHH